MKKLPNNNEPLELCINKQYYVIDALYLTEIKNEFLKANILPKDMRKEIFPYTDTPFALYIGNYLIYLLFFLKKIGFFFIFLVNMLFK